jgi:hypothetical protein
MYTHGDGGHLVTEICSGDYICRTKTCGTVCSDNLMYKKLLFNASGCRTDFLCIMERQCLSVQISHADAICVVR